MSSLKMLHQFVLFAFQATFYPSYREIHGFMSVIICILGSIANVLNIIVLTRKDMNTSPINRILTGKFSMKLFYADSN